MSTEEIVRRLIARYGRTEVMSFTMTSTLGEAGVDELALAQIVVYLEARFDVVIPSLEADRWTTGAAIVDTVQSLLAERHREAS
jgi:acyl carrier protein